MIRHRDFVPAREKAGFLKGSRYDSLERAVDAANEWIHETDAEVISVETVLLPNIYHSGEEGTTDAHLETMEAMTASNEWHQFVRIWYRVPDAT